MCDMFLILKGTYFTGYADDNTPFVVRDNIVDVIKALEEIGESLVNWFSNNEMKLNTDKCHLLLNSQEPNTLKIGDLHMNNSLSEKLLGITFDCKLKFNKHIEDICQKASQKINALARLAPYMGTTKKRIIMNTFFKSQFNYCPLVWMCCNRSLNTKINRLHKRCLQIYNDKKSNFNELLVKDSSASIHHQNLQKLADEMCKVSRGLSLEIVNELFQFREQIPYELRERTQFQIPWVHSVFSRTESLTFLESKIWALVPNEIKQLESPGKFRNAIKQWKPTYCPCRMCKRYIQKIGFL